MDIAAIRNKGKIRQSEGKNEAAEKLEKSAGARLSSSIQGTPAAPQPLAGLSGETSGGAAVLLNQPPLEGGSKSVPDALESLFSRNAELDLATEEGYQQGLEKLQQEEAANVRQWLTFSLGAEEYALDILNIREIIKLREITDIPRVPSFLLGIISLRGTIIPVFDLKDRLRLGRAELSPDSRIVVCRQEDRAAGLLVDRISQVVTLPEHKIEPPPAVLSGLDRDLVEGVGRHQGRMMILLHLSSVLDAELT